MTAEPRLVPSQHVWMTSQGVAAIFSAISRKGGEARFVGGAVRDALLSRRVDDVDLAVNLSPHLVIAALGEAGIKTVPTGLDHGTITAVADHKGYEITTLRKDVETFGRRATVAFTDDWRADAARRDFTMNALYADAAGKIYDYFGGYDDALAGRVRFIGKAEERIREDVLRILRFFRFYAWLGRGDADAEGLQACRELAPLMTQLSVERIWKELGKLLLAPDPVPACRLMIDNGILQPVLPDADGIERLSRLVAIERTRALPPQNLRRLASLIKTGTAADVAQKWRLSNRDKKYLRDIAQLPEKLRGNTDALSLRRLLYLHGAERVRDGLFLGAAKDESIDLSASCAVINAWDSPTFPLQGADILKLGVRVGPYVGKVLEAVEGWWILQDFRSTKEECLKEAQRVIRKI